MKQFAAFIALLLPCCLLAQKITQAKGMNEIRIEKSWTEDYAVSICRENAKLDALQSVFGTSVDQSNTLYTKNQNISGKVGSDILFYSVSNTLINGEWINTKKEIGPIFFEKEGYRWVKIEIEGEVREISKIPFSPEVYPTACLNQSCSTEVFNSGQNFYLHFVAPKNGFVSVFLDDGTFVQRLLPYSKSENENCFSVKADKVYLFFSRDNENNNADEIELFTNHTLEQNRLFILYSTKDFQKPVLEEDRNSDKNGYTFPSKMDSQKFQEWLQKLRIFNKSIELKFIDITIKNK